MLKSNCLVNVFIADSEIQTLTLIPRSLLHKNLVQKSVSLMTEFTNIDRDL